MKELINNLEELNRKAEKKAAETLALKKQHSVGKLTARERIDLLLEKGSFIELDNGNPSVYRFRYGKSRNLPETG